MSGIVGIVNLDGAPVDRDLLRRMTEFMTFRGPDAQEVWIDGSIGFGHTMLRTTFEAETEKQPLTLDGTFWLTADARIDGRAELTSELAAKLRTTLRVGPESRTPNDAELILYAYQAWGEDCVKHLIGDFAFAIWDGRERRLFCARDHFGVKPFYYAHVGNSFVFSNTLNCIRRHPEVADDLNDLAIADYLLSGVNQDPSTTIFRDIRQLRPAHFLMDSGRKVVPRRYWSLPTECEIRYKNSTHYVEHFSELLFKAVDDRLRTNRVAMEMSGGLDSTAVATVAHRILSKSSLPFDLRANTIVYDTLFPDDERYYSGLVAAALHIPIDYLAADKYSLFQSTGGSAVTLPEPFHIEPLGAAFDDFLRRMAGHARVGLTGWDGDSVMNESPSWHFLELSKRLRLRQLVADMSWFIWARRRLPPLGLRRLKRLLRKYRPEPPYPGWVNRAFAERLDLRIRCEQRRVAKAPSHPTRPKAHRVLSSPIWTHLFESYDANVTSLPFEARHPLIDTRLVEYLLAIPAVPWSTDKEILRVSMMNVLPDEVRFRPKQSLGGDPAMEQARTGNVEWIDRFTSTSMLCSYVDRSAIPGIAGEDDTDRLWTNLRPFGLNYWLKESLPVPLKLQSEEKNEYQSKHHENG